MKLGFFIRTFLLFFFLLDKDFIFAQTLPDLDSQIFVHCGTKPPPTDWEKWFSGKISNSPHGQGLNKEAAANYTIPVIVHLIHGNESLGTYPNISSAQVYSQIHAMNDDFAGRGYNVQSLAATGFSLVGAANTGITFCLAQVDPLGNTLLEPGIDRINYVSKAWMNPGGISSVSGFESFIEGTVKPSTIWNAKHYFNIWICDVKESLYLLGYATFPIGTGLVGIGPGLGTSSTDGIWIWTKAFGTTGSLHSVYNKGRTAVHETGHWLGLRHIGGDASNTSGDCSATDYCADTPAQKGGAFGGTNGQNLGKPSYPHNVNVCSSEYGDMFMNFMDYTDDDVMCLFTSDQAIRMQTAMANGTFRSELNNSTLTRCTINYLGTKDEFLNNRQIVIYPNPGSGKFSISGLADSSDEITIRVYDAMGQQQKDLNLMAGTNQNPEFSLEGFPQGLYFVHIISDSQPIVMRLVLGDR